MAAMNGDFGAPPPGRSPLAMPPPAGRRVAGKGPHRWGIRSLLVLVLLTALPFRASGPLRAARWALVAAAILLAAVWLVAIAHRIRRLWRNNGPLAARWRQALGTALPPIVAAAALAVIVFRTGATAPPLPMSSLREAPPRG